MRKQSTLNVLNNTHTHTHNSESVIVHCTYTHLMPIETRFIRFRYSAASSSFIFSNLLQCVTKPLGKDLIPSLVSTVRVELAMFPTGDDAAN